MSRFNDFLVDDSGAVTVDWVVITSAVAIFGTLVLFLITPSVLEMGALIRDMVLKMVSYFP